jgi:hypothetical protein
LKSLIRKTTTRMQLVSSAVLVALLLVCAYALPKVTVDNRAVQTAVARATNYLVSHFSPTVGLIYESEDPGIHWLKRTEYPNYHWRYNQTYWLYSDNLFAIYALLPWRPDISAIINETYHRWNPPFSNKFESVIGVPVGPDRMAVDVLMNYSDSYAILYRLHNGTAGDPRYPFADAIVYHALSEHYLGQQEAAIKDVRRAASLWNGTCLVDSGVKQAFLTRGNAPSDIQWCTNFKIALLLYGAAVVGVALAAHDQMLEQLLRSQQSDGGITTLAHGNGTPSGSANAETTAAFLLIFNTKLIARLNGAWGLVGFLEIPNLPILVFVLLALSTVFFSCYREELPDV